MPKRTLDAFTDAGQQATHGEASTQHRRHSMSCAPLVKCAGTDEKFTTNAAFPARVDSPHAQHVSAPALRQQYFEQKYLADRCVGGVLLVLFSPVIIALYLLVRATSRGPGLYKQERVGLHGEVFEIFKIRSMVQNAEKPGQPQWAVKGDSRVNLVGRVLRKLHLDELPQLYNVYRGEMSLVGPRPERPQICDDLAHRINGYYNRTLVKPGVTGLAQINLPPDESIDDVRRKQILDLSYIENANWWLDTRMVVATALRMFGVKGRIVMHLMRLDRTCLVKEMGNLETHGSAVPARAVRPPGRANGIMDACGDASSATSLSGMGSSDDFPRFSFSKHPR